MLRSLGLGRPAVSISRSVTLSGVGIHSGHRADLTLSPAQCGWWLRERSGSRIEVAQASRVDEGGWSTVLATPDGTRFATVEHILSAISGLGVDGVELSLAGGEEVPILDGSAAPFVDAMRAIGLTELRQEAIGLTPTERVQVEDVDGGSLTVAPATMVGGSYRCRVEFDDLPDTVGQIAEWSPARERYDDAVASARTFAFRAWLDSLARAGRGLGGSLDNAVIFDNGEVLNPGGLRSTNEPARHKLLDLIGDLACLGRPLVARVDAFRPGHTLNGRLVDLLREQQPSKPP